MSARIAVLTFWTCLMVLPAAVQGQGFGIYEQGACVMSRGGAGVAGPCDDGSAVYVNPAGLAGAIGVAIGAGGTFVFGSGSFTSDLGATTKLQIGKGVPPLHAYVRYGITDKLALGIGGYVPYGLRIEWPRDFGGRFVSYDSVLQTTYVQPTVAYMVTPSIAIGGGVTIARGSVELNRYEDLARVPLGNVPGLTFGALVENQTDVEKTTLSASGAMGVGANLGIVAKANDRLRLGVRYLTHVKLAYDGKATFEPVPASFRVTKPNVLGLPVGTPLDSSVSQVQAALQTQSASTELDMPAQFVVGLSVDANQRMTLFGDYQWIDWSRFDTVTLDFFNPIPPDEQLVQNYRDTSAVRLGARFEATPTLRASAGYFYNQAAAPDENVTPLLPEARRNHITAGFGWDLHPKATLDVTYQFIRHEDRRGRIVNPAPGEEPTVSLNSGVYRSRGDLLGITLTLRP